MPCSGVVAWGSRSPSGFAYLIRFPIPVVLRGFPARPRKLYTKNRFSTAGSLPCNPVDGVNGQIWPFKGQKNEQHTHQRFILVSSRKIAGGRVSGGENKRRSPPKAAVISGRRRELLSRSDGGRRRA